MKASIQAVTYASELSEQPSAAGFNSVYHFTDLPSFASGDYLVILDPHCAFLPGNRKGTKIAFQRMKLRDKFPDFTAPFQHFGCTLNEHYQGTLFRFPLRWGAPSFQR